MPTFVMTLFIVSALVLGAWFAVLHALWQAPPRFSTQDPPQPIGTSVQQKLNELTGQQITTEAQTH
jgi:hypothetical protein